MIGGGRDPEGPPQPAGRERGAEDARRGGDPRQAATAAELEVLGERVFCDDELGLAWSEVEALPEDAPLLRVNARNETVLRALAMLEEHDPSQSDDAERAELHRVEGKLDLALELLAELLRERQGALAPRRVRFNARGLCWDCEEAPRVGALLAIDCYALPPWPLPLKLFGRVTAVEPRAAGCRVCTRLEGRTTGVNDWLGKLVFRRHRRSVAQQRHRV
ncbi:MAG TPA: PilZ domain-containing protein [Gammaproteobacteria bacterium]|nr:PilZ domain-containing protein [Gammaproteobacteria bacterium]